MKKILFITDKLDTLKINTDTTYALMHASRFDNSYIRVDELK